MHYMCLKQTVFEDPPYVLTSIRHEDIFLIKQWRNEQIAILRQNVILSDADQEQYWKQEIEPSFKDEKPKQILFSVLHAGKLIGYGGLTHIEWEARRAEVSFLTQTERSHHQPLHKKDFLHFLTLLKNIAFEHLKLRRLYTETYDVRPEVISALEKFGFHEEGRLKEHVKVNDRFVDSIVHGLLNTERTT